MRTVSILVLALAAFAVVSVQAQAPIPYRVDGQTRRRAGGRNGGRRAPVHGLMEVAAASTVCHASCRAVCMCVCTRSGYQVAGPVDAPIVVSGGTRMADRIDRHRSAAPVAHSIPSVASGVVR